MTVIYYRFWAQIQNYSPDLRVLISMGILTIIILILIGVCLLCKGPYYWLLLNLRVGWYLFISNCYYDVRVTREQTDRGRKVREQQNLFIEKNEKKYDKRKQAWMKIKDKKRKFWLVRLLRGIVCGFVIYIVLLCFILVPRYVNVSLWGVEMISHAYENMERKVLEEAQAYEPFWTLEKQIEEPKQMEKPEEPEKMENSGETEQAAEDRKQDVWLRLSEKGWSGSRVREEPDSNAGKIITVISGEVSVKQIGMTEDGKWVQIELENGIQGWIHNSLVEVAE